MIMACIGVTIWTAVTWTVIVTYERRQTSAGIGCGVNFGPMTAATTTSTPGRTATWTRTRWRPLWSCRLHGSSGWKPTLIIHTIAFAITVKITPRLGISFPLAFQAHVWPSAHGTNKLIRNNALYHTCITTWTAHFGSMTINTWRLWITFHGTICLRIVRHFSHSYPYGIWLKISTATLCLMTCLRLILGDGRLNLDLSLFPSFNRGLSGRSLCLPCSLLGLGLFICGSLLSRQSTFLRSDFSSTIMLLSKRSAAIFPSLSANLLLSKLSLFACDRSLPTPLPWKYKSANLPQDFQYPSSDLFFVSSIACLKRTTALSML